MAPNPISPREGAHGQEALLWAKGTTAPCAERGPDAGDCGEGPPLASITAQVMDRLPCQAGGRVSVVPKVSAGRREA